MGLLSHISNSGSRSLPKKKETGLLAKALQSSGKNIDSFQEWSRSKGFDHCGLFTSVHGMMVITHAYGIDSQTIASSVSSKDFWLGTLRIKGNAVNYTKADQEFYNFLQFFSFDIRNSVTHISFIKTGSDEDFELLLIYNLDSDNAINAEISDTETLVKNNLYKERDFSKLANSISDYAKTFNYHLMTLNLKDVIMSSIKSIQLPEANLKKAVADCVYEQAFDLLNRAFPAPNGISYKDKFDIKICFVETENVDENLIFSHICLLLRELLCKTAVQPAIVDSKRSQDVQFIVSYLG